MTTRTFDASGVNQVLSPRIVERQLARLSGVRAASASYASRSVTVTYDQDAICADVIAARIRE